MPAKPQATLGAGPGHESRDINFRWVVITVTTVLVSAAVVHVVIWWFQKWVSPGRLQINIPTELQPATPVIPQWSAAPEPRLQFSPRADMDAFRAREEAELHSYGWIDRTGGVVRLPIERAMDLIVQRGFPTRTNGVQQTGGKTPLELLQERRLREAEKTVGQP
jgi:hypothetical protein